jgi:hypothetical protein
VRPHIIISNNNTRQGTNAKQKSKSKSKSKHDEQKHKKHMLIKQKNLLGFILFSFCSFPYGGAALNLKTSNPKPNSNILLRPNYIWVFT